MNFLAPFQPNSPSPLAAPCHQPQTLSSPPSNSGRPRAQIWHNTDNYWVRSSVQHFASLKAAYWKLILFFWVKWIRHLAIRLPLALPVHKLHIFFDISYDHVHPVYCHPAYLTSMQSTSCEMPGWMKLKLESSLLEKTVTTSDTQMIPP